MCRRVVRNFARRLIASGGASRHRCCFRDPTSLLLPRKDVVPTVLGSREGHVVRRAVGHPDPELHPRSQGYDARREGEVRDRPPRVRGFERGSVADEGGHAPGCCFRQILGNVLPSFGPGQLRSPLWRPGADTIGSLTGNVLEEIERVPAPSSRCLRPEPALWPLCLCLGATTVESW